jgi:hypothetical protein
MEEMRNAYRILVGKPERKRPRGSLCVGGRIILKRISRKCVRDCGLEYGSG